MALLKNIWSRKGLWGKSYRSTLIQTVKFVLLRILTWHFKHKPTGVVIIRNDHLGDILISLSLIEQAAAIAHRRAQTITVVTSSGGHELLRNCTYIDNLVVCDYSDLSSGIWNRIKEYRKITCYQAQKVILLPSLGRSGESDYLALLPPGKQHYAIETMNVWPVEAAVREYRAHFFNFFYDFLLDYDKSCTVRENEARLLSFAMEEIIYPQKGSADHLGEFPPCQISECPYILVVPGSFAPGRRWPAERFAAVVDRILAEYPSLSVVISGSSSDNETAEKLLAHSRSREKIIYLCGKSTLRQLFSNVKNAEFIISNDTGTIHVAAILEKKCFCIGGNWHYGAYNPDPFCPSNIFINADTPCRHCFEKCHALAEERFSCLMLVTVEKVTQTIFREISPSAAKESRF